MSNSSRIVELLGGITRGITALAGGANSGSTPVMSEGINVIAVVATAGDSVILPAGIGVNNRVIVANLDADIADVFPNTGATINAAAADANLGIAAISVVEFIQIGETGLEWLAINNTTAVS